MEGGWKMRWKTSSKNVTSLAVRKPELKRGKECTNWYKNVGFYLRVSLIGSVCTGNVRAKGVGKR